MEIFGKDGAELPASSRMVIHTDCGDGGSRYSVSFMLNDAFKPAKVHSAEAWFLYSYAPDSAYGGEGDTEPYIAVLLDDEVYCAVEEYKDSGTIEGAEEVTATEGQFYFRAKMEYFGDMMYFYGFDRCGGFWENNGLCMVYPRELSGSEAEKKLMRVLDEAAGSWSEKLCE